MNYIFFTVIQSVLFVALADNEICKSSDGSVNGKSIRRVEYIHDEQVMNQ